MKNPCFLVLFFVVLVGLPQFLPADELNNAITRAEEAHALAISIQGPAYFPGEWEAAQAQFTQAGQLPRGSEAAIRTATEAFNTAADSYDLIVRMTAPLYAQAREDEIMELRNYLIVQGARRHYAELLRPADTAAIHALEMYEAGDYHTARNTAAEVLQMYQVLTVAFDALQIKWEIDERDFEYYDPDNYDRAIEMLEGAIDDFNTGNFAAAIRNAEEAYLRYNLVLATAWAGYAEMRASLAEGERQAAFAMNTNSSARDFFAIADAEMSAAQTLLDAERYEEASRSFTNAEAMFVIASMTALERRMIAIESLREAYAKIEESESLAAEAETFIGGGSR